MAYQALYRVWRSQRFEDIVGQKAVTQTLRNAIMQHKTSHAYLFTGPEVQGRPVLLKSSLRQSIVLIVLMENPVITVISVKKSLKAV